MKLRFKISLFILMSCVLFHGCETTPLVQDALQEPVPGEIVFLPTGGTQEFVMSFPGSWAISSPVDWVSISRTSGKEGTFSILFSASVNRTNANRSCTIDIRAGENETKRITVRQDYPFLRMQIMENGQPVSSAKDSLVFAWNESEEAQINPYRIRIESNVDWQFKLDENQYGADNFHLSDISGFGSKTIDLRARVSNTDRKPFSSALQLDAYMPESDEKIGEGVESYSLDIEQKNLKFLINDTNEDVFISIDELNKSIINGKIQIDSELPWSVSNGTDWVNMSSLSGPADTLTVWLKADGANPLLEERVRDIVIRSEGGAERILHVSQDPYIFQFSNDNLTIGNKAASESTFELQTTGPWEVIDPPTWISVSPTSGEKGGMITISCPNQNMETEDLAASLHFASKLNTIKRDISVTQNRFLFDIVPSETLSKIPTLSTKPYDASIQCSGKWSISVEKDWIGVSSTQGEGSKGITIKALNVNPSMTADRSGKVTLVSESHKAIGINLTKDIDIRQTKFLFDISTSETSLPAYTETKQFQMNIVCSEKWEITDYPSWLEPDKTNGEFDTPVSFKILSNSSLSDKRFGRITVRSLYTKEDKTTDVITQDPLVFAVEGSTSYSNLSPINNAPISVRLNCTEELPWTITTSGQWVDVSQRNGDGTQTLTFTATDNLATTERSQQFTIRNRVTNTPLTITFNQNRFIFSVSANSSYSFSELDTKKNTFIVDCTSDWTIDKSNATWIKFTPDHGTGRQTVTLEVDKNTTLNDRSANVIIYSNLQHGSPNELSQSINIRQTKFIFDPHPLTYSIDAINENNTTFQFDMTCSGNWVAYSIPDWLSVSPDAGNGGTVRVSIRPSDNTNLETRRSTVAFVSSDNNSLQKNVTVAQKAFIFSTSITSRTIEAAQNNFTCSVNCSSGWKVSTTEDWLHVNTTSGDKNASFTISADRNTSKSQRQGNVIVTSDLGNHTITIKVTQKGR